MLGFMISILHIIQDLSQQQDVKFEIYYPKDVQWRNMDFMILDFHGKF